jgi:hypothetical protein
MTETIAVKNKKTLIFWLVLIIIGASWFTLAGLFPLTEIGELTFFILVLWILSLFIKWEVK